MGDRHHNGGYVDIEACGTTHCAVCRQRITMRGWEPFCCEVCWDSADAEDHEMTVRMLRDAPNCGHEWCGADGGACPGCGSDVSGVTRAAEIPRA